MEKIALKVQLSVIQLSRSQSISYLNSNCIEVLKIKELYFLFCLYFEINEAIKYNFRFKLKN